MPEPKLLEQVRQTARLKHFGLRTERAYAQRVYRFVAYHGKRHPREMGAREVQAFLTWLAVERDVAASTQNQALCALLFLYRKVLRIDLPRIEEAVRRTGVGVAIRFSFRPAVDGPALRPPRPAPSVRIVHPEGGRERAVRQAGIVKPAGCHTLRHFVRHAHAGGRLRHPHRPGIARPR